MLRRVNRVLIANRGEIALRIIKACRNTGKTSILAYSKADKNTIPVEEADESICIGPPPAQQSYLSIPALLTAARLTASIRDTASFQKTAPSPASVRKGALSSSDPGRKLFGKWVTRPGPEVS